MPGISGPADAGTETFYYFGFGAGEFGAQAGHLVGFRLFRQTLYYAGAFTAKNVVRYIDGSLGPRVEAADITPSGLPATRCFGMGMGTAPGNVTQSSPLTQYLWAMYSDGAPGSVNGNGGTYRIPLAAGGTALKFSGPNIPVPQSGAGTLPVTQRNFGAFTTVAQQTTAIPDFGGMIQSVPIGNTVYLTSQGNGFYVILFDPQFTGQAGVVGFVGKSNDPDGSFPDGYPLCLYGTFMVGTSFTTPNQLLFSADGNYLSWPGTFLNVGDSTPIVGLFPTRHGLYVAKSTAWPMLTGQPMGTSSVDEWWLMTGTPGTGAIVRKVLDGPAATQDSGVVLGDGTIGYLAPGATQGPSPLQMTPSIFTGSAIQSFRYLEGIGQFTLANYAGFNGWFPKVVRLREPHDWLALPAAQSAGSSTATGFVRKDGIWTAQNLGTVASGGLVGVNVTAVSDPQNDRVVIATPLNATAPLFPGGGSSFQSPASQHIQQWSAYVDGPASSPYVQADKSLCQVTLPEWTSRSGGEVAVRTVWVDFETWTADTNPAVTLTLTPLRLYESGDGAPVPLVYQGLTSVANPPVRRRHAFNYPTVFGDAFQLTFSGLNGVSIAKVEVLMETRPGQS